MANFGTEPKTGRGNRDLTPALPSRVIPCFAVYKFWNDIARHA